MVVHFFLNGCSFLLSFGFPPPKKKEQSIIKGYRVVAGERTDTAAVVLAALLGQEAQRAAARGAELTVRHGYKRRRMVRRGMVRRRLWWMDQGRQGHWPTDREEMMETRAR